ncbi:MAG: thioesterase family protein, partial [Dermatophilaceae bacterium]|nr:thioesterase family protein [Dermatophilaceae bacterium]
MTSDPTGDRALHQLDHDTAAFYRRLGPGLYAPTVHVQGAWRDDEQHMAPVSGILAHEIDLHEPREGMQLARISFDILGMIPARPSRVDVRTTRPG